MPSFSIKKAREGGHITDKELERFAAMYMICQDQIKPTTKQYEQLAKDIGGTPGSFKFACYAAIKKLKENNCYVDDEAGSGQADNDAAEKPKSKKGASKKRKAVEDGETEQSNKKGRAAKDAIKTEAEDDSV